MQTRRIGSLDASLLGLGCNNFGMRIDAAQTDAVVGAAIDAGVTYFDTANAYGGGGKSEELLGGAIAGRRDQVVVATKFGHPAMLGEGETPGRPDLIEAACDASLARLGIEVIDHYQLHVPDPVVPIGETLGALQGLIDAGKVRELGCSNFTADMLRDAAAAAEADGTTMFASVQNRYSVLHREPEENGVLDACADLGVAFVPYFPLESGLLTGKYRKGEDLPEGSRLAAWKDAPQGERFLNDEKVDGAEALIGHAEATGVPILSVAMSWLAAQPAVASIIAGATKPEQVVGNAAALGLDLDAGALAAIDQVLGH